MKQLIIIICVLSAITCSGGKTLDDKIKDYEDDVKKATEWDILTRGAMYSDNHKDEWTTINILLNIKNWRFNHEN